MYVHVHVQIGELEQLLATKVADLERQTEDLQNIQVREGRERGGGRGRRRGRDGSVKEIIRE